MILNLTGPVGLRHRTQPVRNLQDDQWNVIAMLEKIDFSQGGNRNHPTNPPLAAGPDGQCPPALMEAIWTFQGHWRAEGLTQDGVVDPGGKTLRKLNELAFSPGAHLGGPIFVHQGIEVRQGNPPELTQRHILRLRVINPWRQDDRYTELIIEPRVHEFLFQLRKDGSVFWVGATVPVGIVDFSRVQVFFHPTVVQSGIVKAADADYPAFGGGWSGNMQRYVATEGGQLAAARLMALIVPFTTMAALGGNPAHNMFSARPLDTLMAVMGALQATFLGPSAGLPTLASVGVASFSNGIMALRRFLQDLAPHGLVREVTDLDSPWITSEPKALTPAPGAVSKCYTQVALPNPPVGWVHLSAQSLADVNPKLQTHGKIGEMAFYMAMMTSVIL